MTTDATIPLLNVDENVPLELDPEPSAADTAALEAWLKAPIDGARGDTDQ